MYSFSTCWNSHRHTDGRAMLREIHELAVCFTLKPVVKPERIKKIRGSE